MIKLHEEFQYICDHVACDKALQKDIVFDLSQVRDAADRERIAEHYGELIQEKLPTVSPTALYFFLAITFGFLDRKIDQLQSYLTVLNKSIAVAPTRARRANLLTRAYDAKNKRDEVLDIIQNEWLSEIKRNYEEGMEITPEQLELKQARDAARQIDLATINALNMHDKDIPKIILSDINYGRSELAAEEQAEINPQDLVI
jgi:hypothetical protein